MERYYIYGGDYAEALEFAATFLEIPDGEPVSDYAEVLTEEEYEEEYGNE